MPSISAISPDDIVCSLTMIDSYTRLISSLSLILSWEVVNVKEKKEPFAPKVTKQAIVI